MILSDFHTHTNYCDGRNTPEEMVQAAIDRGLSAIGFSGHAYTSFDAEWCMSLEGMQLYREEIGRLKDAYKDRIRILCGAEWDYYSDGPKEGLEYLIGSVHYVEKNGIRRTVDESPEAFAEVVRSMFDGDYYAAAENYYEKVGEILDRTKADIVGHFDLITKFNEGGRLFDEKHPRYRKAWQQAADRLLPFKKPFEINTGAISRGYRTSPYPSQEIMDYIGSRGGCFILSSDSHRTDTLLCGFEQWEAYVLGHGWELAETPLPQE